MKYFLYILLVLNTFGFAQKPELVLRTGFNSITSLCYSHDDEYIVCGDQDGAIKIINTSTGQELRNYEGHNSRINSIEFDSDNKHFVTASDDGSIKYWNINNSDPLYTMKGKDSTIYSVCMSSKNNLIFTGGNDPDIKIYSANKLILLRMLKGHKNTIYNIKISNNGNILYSCSKDSTIILWDLLTFKEIRKIYDNSKVYSIAISPDSKFLASFNSDTLLNIRNLKTNKIIKQIHIDKWHLSSGSINFSRDGSRIFLTDMGRILVYNIINNDNYKIPVGSMFCTYNLSHKNNTICIGEMKKIFIYDINSKKIIKEFKSQLEAIYSLSFSENGQYLLCSDATNLIFWNLKDSKVSKINKAHESQINCSDFSPDGKLVISGGMDDTIKLWNVESKKLEKIFTGHTSAISSVHFLQSGENILSGSYDGTAKLWSIKDENLIKTFKGHSGCVYDIALTNDSLHFITAGEDKKLILWDLNSGNILNTFIGHERIVCNVSISNDDNLILSNSGDNSLRLWDINSGIEIKRFNNIFDKTSEIQFIENNKFITSDNKNSVVIWNLETNNYTQVFERQRQYVGCIKLIPKRNIITSGGWDGKLKLWDINSGKELASLISLDATDWAVVTPDGYFDASPGGMKNFYYVQGLEVVPIERFFDNYFTPGLLAKVINGEKYQREENTIDFSIGIPESPKVKILSPVSGSVFKEKEIELSVEITKGAKSLIGVKISQNGKKIKQEEKGVDLLTERITYKIELTRDTNVIEVVAYDSEMESDPASVKLICTKGSEKPNLYILSIGINDYNNISKLKYCKSDVEDFTTTIMEKGWNIFQNIILKTIFDKEANKENIIKAFEQVENESNKEDVFIFYFSGHGALGSGISKKKPDYYIMMQDVSSTDYETKGISAKELGQHLNKIKALKQIIILDACYSASALEDIAFNIDKGIFDEEEAQKRLGRSSGVFLLAASGKNQTAKEIPQLKHGLFTYTILEGLNCEGDIGRKDNLINIMDMINFTNNRVYNLMLEYNLEPQRPRYWANIDFDFPIGICK
jgi:WD40 repeat protein